MAHGGKRQGSGRPTGSRNKATAELKLSLTEIAQVHCPDAVEVLIEVATRGTSESARVSAANSILDRGFGKPTQRSDVSLNSESLPTLIELVAKN
jgi:hypothetical protein